MDHDALVQRIADQVRAAHQHGRPVEFAKGSVSHLVPNPYREEGEIPKVDLTGLDRVLSIDAEAMTCTAESGVTFVRLVEETLRHGLVPYTVSELREITIGGAVSGCSVESESYRHGGFHDSCLEYEVVTGTGEVRVCSKEEDADLFHMLHGSYGTLGILTKLTFKLHPGKPFVRVENRLHESFEAFWTDCQERCETGDYTFVDGIIHGPDRCVLCLGEFVDEASDPSDYTGADIYYKSTLTRRDDVMTTEQYYFRYDTECHWLTRTAPGFENPLFRRALGRWFLGSTNLIRWSNRMRKPLRLIKKRPDVVVDVFIPSQRFAEFFDWYAHEFRFYPLWIVPYRMPEVYPWVADEHSERVGETFVIDAAIYGKANGDPDVDFSEVLERKVYELAGTKTLISRNHYDEQTFWSIYSKPRYEAAKARLDPEGVFGGLYETFAPERYRS